MQESDRSRHLSFFNDKRNVDMLLAIVADYEEALKQVDQILGQKLDLKLSEKISLLKLE